VKHLNDPHVKSWRAIVNSYIKIFTILEKSMREDESVTYARFHIFFICYFEGSKAPVELARRLGVTRGNMSMLIKRMVVDDHLAICPDSESKQRPHYCLTDTSVEIFENILPGHVKKIRTLIPVLPPDFIDILNNV